MQQLTTPQLETLVSVAGWITVITAFLAAGAGLIGFFGSAELDRRTDLRVANAERAGAEAGANAAAAGAAAATANRRTAELQRQSAALEHQAAEARLETERLRQRLSWRVIDDQHAERFSNRLRRFDGQHYVLLLGSERETRSLARSVNLLLQDAGWAQQMPSGDPPIVPDLKGGLVEITGIHIVTAPGSPVEAAAANLRDAFTESGLPALHDHHSEYNDRPSVIGVYVGSKPRQD